MNEKGITLTSLIVYVIGMTIVLGTVATITSFFYKNMNIGKVRDNNIDQYSNFSSIFSSEINLENNYIIDCKTEQRNEKKISYIIFSSGNQYTFMEENKSIFKNKIKICEDIDDCDFNYSYQNSKYNIRVNFKTKDMDLTGQKAISYTI